MSGVTTSWVWNDYTLDWSTPSNGQTSWLLHEQIPRNTSIQRFILTGGLSLYNNDGWLKGISNPMFAHEWVELTVNFSRDNTASEHLLRRSVGTSPVIEATAGTLHEVATVGWHFPFQMFEVDMDIRWRARFDETFLNVQAICHASKTDQGAMLPKVAMGQCWARILTSVQTSP